MIMMMMMMMMMMLIIIIIKIPLRSSVGFFINLLANTSYKIAFTHFWKFRKIIHITTKSTAYKRCRKSQVGVTII